MKAYKHQGALKKRIVEALGGFTDLSLEQKDRIWGLVEQFFEPKTTIESVTRIS